MEIYNNMKDVKFFTAVFLSSFIIGSFTGYFISFNSKLSVLTNRCDELERKVELIQNVENERTNNSMEKKVKWDMFITALAQTESSDNPKAHNNKTDAAGWLQETPVYVREVNRILGEERYTLDDRYNKKKAIEMFNIYQGKHNPERDIHWALKLHNPRSKYTYHIDVLNNYNNLVKSSEGRS